MASEGKKVKFDPFNVLVRHDPSPSVVDAIILIPCDDGSVAEVRVSVESPTKMVEDSKTTYDLKVMTTSEVRRPDVSLEEAGRRERNDGLSWEIPKNFPGASVALFEHEKRVKELIMKHFKEGNVFVDVGANFGGYSVRAAAWDMKVYAFEPNPDNLKLLERNAEINHVSVNAFPYAIGSEAAKVRLTPNGGLSRVVQEGGIEVEMRTLDSFDLPGADVLKIDVEGYELEVLKGAKKTLAKFHPVIFIEMHYWAGAPREAELFRMLSELGYSFEYIDRFGQGMHLLAKAA